MDDADQFEAASTLLQLQENARWCTNRDEVLDVAPTPPPSDFEPETHNDCSIFSSVINCPDNDVFAKMKNFSPTTMDSICHRNKSGVEGHLMTERG